jgi:hypothetical protein
MNSTKYKKKVEASSAACGASAQEIGFVCVVSNGKHIITTTNNQIFSTLVFQIHTRGLLHEQASFLIG